MAQVRAYAERIDKQPFSLFGRLPIFPEANGETASITVTILLPPGGMVNEGDQPLTIFPRRHQLPPDLTFTQAELTLTLEEYAARFVEPSVREYQTTLRRRREYRRWLKYSLKRQTRAWPGPSSDAT